MPARPRVSAISLPIPREAPVTSATRYLSDKHHLHGLLSDVRCSLPVVLAPGFGFRLLAASSSHHQSLPDCPVTNQEHTRANTTENRQLTTDEGQLTAYTTAL